MNVCAHKEVECVSINRNLLKKLFIKLTLQK